MMINKYIILLVAGILPATGFAQKKKKDESVSLVKEFAQVCNLYKRTPLHLSVEYTQTATIIVSAADQATAKAEFFLTDDGAYIRFGNTEQIVTDSLLLMVSLDQRMMMLADNAEDIRSRMNNYLGMQLADSSVQKMADEYSAVYLPATGEEKIIELTNKAHLPGTDIVKEIISVRYNAKTKDPLQVVYLRRTLVPVSDEYIASRQTGTSDLIKIKDNYFMMNERTGTFKYTSIDHSEHIKLPVRLADRIRKNEDGKIIPANGFENYYVQID
jgi:hypothetical protein